MASLAVVKVYACAHILLALAVLLLATIRIASRRLRRPVSYRHQLRLGQTLAVAIVLLPVFCLIPGRRDFLPQTAQVWSAPTLQDVSVARLEHPVISVSFAPPGKPVSLSYLSRAIVALCLTGLLFALARIAVDATLTMRIVADTQAIRRLGRLRILASERTHTPFSFWLPGRCFIVVPMELILHAADLKMAIRHEAQHHRQGDTRWLYLYPALKALFFWNPAAHILEKRLRELQEFACDEALSGRGNIAIGDYCRCLLRAAEVVTRQRYASLRAGMAGGAGSALRRRIHALLHRPTQHSRGLAVLVAALASFATMTATALAFGSSIHDRRVSAAEADRMAAIARQGTAFPISMNEHVLKQLNLLLATPDGRAYLQASLARMQRHRALISQQTAHYGLPPELLAVPLVESGYRNLPPGDDPRHGAGLWMFIAPTAERFGLAVGASRDDRLDVPAQTDAAMRYFTALHRQFNDWGLSLLAYNIGNPQVEHAIRETGSRDAWRIIERGYENDPEYLPRVMAAILILKNPNALEAR
jgi:beta-lactamase regulating signal transducer with metallopeptidase domain